jgi:hypothetical protein
MNGGSTVSWIARPLPTLQGQPKFLTPIGGSGPPFIPKSVYNSKKGSPIIITEGPAKALVLAQAGFPAIGLNGVWCAQEGSDRLILRRELRELELHGRKLYMAFDADAGVPI